MYLWSLHRCDHDQRQTKLVVCLEFKFLGNSRHTTRYQATHSFTVAWRTYGPSELLASKQYHEIRIDLPMRPRLWPFKAAVTSQRRLIVLRRTASQRSSLSAMRWWLGLWRFLVYDDLDTRLWCQLYHVILGTQYNAIKHNNSHLRLYTCD